jgi:predicted nucleotidyltransferase
MSPEQEEVINLLREHYPALAAEYGIQRLGVFGSFARGTATAASDVDVVVEFKQPIGFKFIELGERLEHLLNRKVDVLTPEGIRGIRIPRVAQDIVENIVYV